MTFLEAPIFLLEGKNGIEDVACLLIAFPACPRLLGTTKPAVLEELQQKEAAHLPALIPVCVCRCVCVCVCVCVHASARARTCTHKRGGERKDSFPNYCASELPPLDDEMSQDLDDPVEKFLTHHPPRVHG